jgi:tripeptide aminopeptidase
MTSFDTQLLYNILSIQSASRNQQAMQAYLHKKVRKLGATTVAEDRDGNIYVTKGESDGRPYPTVVAHMDTVHTVLPHDQFTILSLDGTWFAYNPIKRKPTGIGGDDKVGVFIALTMLKTFDRIKLAFFVDEEIGCKGSRWADMAFFDDAAFVIQCDRQGYGDVVQDILGTALFGDEFDRALQPYLKQYQMKGGVDGGLTDVAELKENGLAVACTNISCGYYLPHTVDEFIVLADVRDTTNFVHDVIHDLGDRQWTHTCQKPASRYGALWGTGKPYHVSSKYGDWKTYSLDKELEAMWEAPALAICPNCDDYWIDCQCQDAPAQLTAHAQGGD